MPFQSGRRRVPEPEAPRPRARCSDSVGPWPERRWEPRRRREPEPQTPRPWASILGPCWAVAGASAGAGVSGGRRGVGLGLGGSRPGVRAGAGSRNVGSNRKRFVGRGTGHGIDQGIDHGLDRGHLQCLQQKRATPGSRELIVAEIDEVNLDLILAHAIRQLVIVGPVRICPASR